MSKPRYRIHPKVLALLHERGETVESLAQQAGTSRAHATQVLAGVPGRGYHTRRRLAPLLTLGELELLGWNWDGRPLPVERSKSEISKTEWPCPNPLPAVGEGGATPKGLGRDGHEPLMQNRAPLCAASPTGLLPATLSVSDKH